MDNKTYLVRAAGVALLLWGSVATVMLVAQRSSPTASSDSGHVVAGK